ncbi:uncharacterized protein LOC103696012 isoform X1 [Phoenix dactylifera]|uniref:Uncharacterized protein LOC103696012 isoform X1 n=1 Tax=Phoenix dactylifera TaxID=42345 RepID=A0A8B8IZN2_PHODC|nr:uncharacterized protein LOC103696012 isoform X1 [Phoenix dactylifera]
MHANKYPPCPDCSPRSLGKTRSFYRTPLNLAILIYPSKVKTLYLSNPQPKPSLVLSHPSRRVGVAMASGSVQKSEEEWRAILAPEQFRILRMKGTESLAFQDSNTSRKISLLSEATKALGWEKSGGIENSIPFFIKAGVFYLECCNCSEISNILLQHPLPKLYLFKVFIELHFLAPALKTTHVPASDSGTQRWFLIFC